MSGFKLGGMTLGSLFKKPETLQYPFQKKEPYPGQKGHIVCNVSKCILCSICAKTCPCHCIEVSKEERKWGIDPFLCIQCGSCVRACPKQCLVMEGDCTPVSAAQYCNDQVVPDQSAA